MTRRTPARARKAAGALLVVALLSTAAPPSASAQSAAVVQATPKPPRRTLPLVLLGLGGALFVGGEVLGLVGVVQASNAPTRDGADASSARTKGIAGDVIGGAGLATAAVGILLLLTQGPPSPSTTVARRPALSGSATEIEIRF